MTQYKNPEQIKEGVLWLLENKENQKIVTDNAYQKAIEMYQFETMFQNHINLYKNI
jgi:glycosyltransferase involved in cell wall biosynthesis